MVPYVHSLVSQSLMGLHSPCFPLSSQAVAMATNVMSNSLIIFMCLCVVYIGMARLIYL
mgnify:CR=1 FL=1